MIEWLFMVIGIAGGYLFRWLFEWMELKGKYKGIKEIKEAVKKKKKLFLLETDNAFWVGGEKASYQNLSVTKGRNLVLVAPNSVKPAYGLGGVLLGVGDLYRSSTIPKELRQTIVFLKLIGFSDKDIKIYLSTIHGQGVFKEMKKEDVGKVTAVEQAEKFLLKRLDEMIKEAEEKGNKDKADILKLIKEKKEIYLSTPSTIVNYLQTGINRVTLKSQLKQIVDEKKLEKLGQTNWLMIGLAIFLVLLGLWFFFGNGGNIISSIGKMIHPTTPTPPPR